MSEVRPVLPPGIHLDDGETVTRTGRDWGASIPVVLTSRHLICPLDPSGGGLVKIPLSDIERVHLKKPPFGFASVIVEYGPGRRASFPVHANAQQAIADISAAAQQAREAIAGTPSVPSGSSGDRYDQLRKLGELRTAGVLTEAEFQEEKARILARP
jgi:hypothetical protein